VTPFDAPARLRVISLANEPAVAAVPAGLVRKGMRTVPLDLIAQQLVLFPRNEGPVLYDAILAMFRTRGIVARVVQESPRMLTTLGLVAAGCGATLVPAALARSVSIKGVAFRPLEPSHDMPTWPVALAHMPLSAGSDAAKLLARWRPQTIRV
jgi:DNA-binding transcriptional LysR family regulator